MRISEMESRRDFTATSRRADGRVTFLPEPEARRRELLLISADDHLIEPPTTFAGRVPQAFIDRAPRVVERADGTQAWLYEGKEFENIGFNAVAGRPLEECGMEPQRFDDMRPGAWDVHNRVRDMDIDGVYASLSFPSALVGFSGQRLQLETNDAALAHSLVRAYNSWQLEEWAGAYPERFIPCQIPYLLDPAVAAAEVRRNTARGFKALTFTEAPHLLGLPSLHSGYWDPLMAACAETGTVVCLHVGSGETLPSTAPDAPPETIGVLFFAYSLFAATDWLFSGIALRYPGIQIVLAEGGIAWVPGLIDRLRHMLKYRSIYKDWGSDLTPAEVFLRNFWFCTLEDPSTMRLLDTIGPTKVMFEVDYPHLDTSWPDSQAVARSQLRDLTPEQARRVAWENASELFRHPVPEALHESPEHF